MDETGNLKGLGYDHKTCQVVGGTNETPHEKFHTLKDLVDFLKTQGTVDSHSSLALVGAFVAAGKRLNLCPISVEPSPLKKGVPSSFYEAYLAKVRLISFLLGIFIVAIISDNDTRMRYNTMESCLKENMKEGDHYLEIDHPASRFVALYLLDEDGNPKCPVAVLNDVEHLEKSWRNNATKFHALGDKPIAWLHIDEVRNAFPYAAHGLGLMDTNIQDRQKVLPAERVLDPRVRDCLRDLDKNSNTNEREGLILYLEVGAMLRDALLSRTLGFLERIYKVWFVHFFLKFWKDSFMRSDSPYPRSLSRNLLPSQQMMDAVEITANGLTLLIVIMAEHYPNHPLLIDQANTRKLENFFGDVRQQRGNNSNQTIKEFLPKARKAVIQATCEAAIKQNSDKFSSPPSCNDGNCLPATIPNLRTEINKMIDKASKDCHDRLEPFFSPVVGENSSLQEDEHDHGLNSREGMEEVDIDCGRDQEEGEVRIVCMRTKPDTRPPVADGLAGAEMRVFPLFNLSVTHQPTNQ